VEERSSISRAVILPGAKIGAGCTIDHAILDEGCEIPAGMQIGIDPVADARRFYMTENGVVLVTADMLARLAAAGA
jgi:glucose-1-phosphate adenylyltransferase